MQGLSQYKNNKKCPEGGSLKNVRPKIPLRNDSLQELNGGGKTGNAVPHLCFVG